MTLMSILVDCHGLYPQPPATAIEVRTLNLYSYLYEYEYLYLYVSDLLNVTISTSTPCLWILYGNMVDFSFIVSLYVSDLPNVTISTPCCRPRHGPRCKLTRVLQEAKKRRKLRVRVSLLEYYPGTIQIWIRSGYA